MKPAREDGSIGIEFNAVVSSIRELMERIDWLHANFDSPVLIEEYVEGREMYVGVLGNEIPTALPVVELDLSKLPESTPRIAGAEVKWGKGTRAYRDTKSAVAEDLPEETVSLLQQTAIAVFQALELRDYARIDMRLRPDGRVAVIEANPNPWLASKAEFVMAARKSGRNYTQLIGEIVQKMAFYPDGQPGLDTRLHLAIEIQRAVVLQAHAGRADVQIIGADDAVGDDEGTSTGAGPGVAQAGHHRIENTGEDAEEGSSEQHIMKMSNNIVGIGDLPVHRNDGQMNSVKSADQKHSHEPNGKQHGAGKSKLAFPSTNGVSPLSRTAPAEAGERSATSKETAQAHLCLGFPSDSFKGRERYASLGWGSRKGGGGIR